MAQEEREDRQRSEGGALPDDSGRLTDAGYEHPRYYDRPGSAYDIRDPKHPDHHDVFADVADMRED